MDRLLGTGLYPLRQAARLVHAEPRTVRRWLKGYSWKYKSGRSVSGPLWRTQHFDSGETPASDIVLGFRDLLELRMVAEFVKHGVSLVLIRATIEEASKSLGQYPLSNREFRTDGRRIFLDAIEKTTGHRKMLDVASHQFVFQDVIRPSLYSGIVYDDGAATRWYPMPKRKAVVLDPGIQFGAPVLTEFGVPTDIVHAAWVAEGESTRAVSRAFEVPHAAVLAAVAFERQYLAAAA